MSSIPGLLWFRSARRARGVFILSFVLALALGACGQGATANQTPSASATSTSTPTPTPTPKPGSAFSYAFARGGQVWVAQAGKTPQQLSQLPDAGGFNVSALAWSPDGKHLAFERAGVGNPVDYVIDTTTGNFMTLNVPSTPSAASLGWADKNTVVAIKIVGGNTQFWKVDITSNAPSEITQVNGTPQVKVLGESIYYSVLDSNSNQLMLHRYDINLGSEGTPVAITPAGASTLNVNWDVSPDGTHVAMGFKLDKSDASWDNGFWYINFSDNTDRQPIFDDSEIPFSTFTANDPITLSFSPDSQSVVLDTQNSAGPASEGVDDSNFTTYSPHVGITSQSAISWAPNGASFALISDGNSGQATIYTLGSKVAGASFVDQANLLTWAPQS